jgi:uncharacterized protein (DUF433 family)
MEPKNIALRSIAQAGSILKNSSVKTHTRIIAFLQQQRYDTEQQMDTTFDRITIDPEQMNGQPCIRGMRLTVRRVVKAAALYSDRAELKQEYPELEDDDIRQALEYAASSLDDQVVFLNAA